MPQADVKKHPVATDLPEETKTIAEPPPGRLESVSLFPLPLRLTRADRHRIAILAGTLLREPG